MERLCGVLLVFAVLYILRITPVAAIVIFVALGLLWLIVWTLNRAHTGQYRS
jgi:hypothetical protein